MIIRSTLYRWCFTALATAGVLAAGCGDDSNKAKNDAGTPKDGALDAKFDETATLTIAPLTSDFGTVTSGQSSTATAFTVTNTGTGTSDQVQVNLSGSPDYHIASNTCVTLAPAATCAIGVVYSPTSAGASNATLLVTVTGSSASSMLSGTGGKIGNLSVSPSAFTFANATVGTPGTDSDSITVTNTGGQASGALTVQAVGSDPTQFTKSADTCSGMTLASGASCTLTVKFAPTSAGAKAAGFTIIGNPGGNVTASFSGNAATAALLAISPATQSFGSVVQGQTSSTVAINVANIGGSTTGALTAALSGANASSYAIVTNTCTGTLATASSCQLTLRYTPSLIGNEVATLTVSGTPGGSVTSSLNGTGITPGGLTVTPTAFNFAATQVGATTAGNTFTVTNGGGTSVSPIVVNLSGGDASQFRIVAGQDNCTNTTLAPAGQCSFQVAFAPSSVGSKSASAVVSGGASSIPVALTGLGTPAPQLAITPNTRDFGSNGVGTTSTPLTFVVSNAGGAPTTVPTISLSGPNASQFAQTNNCSAALPVGGSCTVSVTFSPTAIGLDSAILTATAATGGTVTANIFGQGNNPAQLSVLPGNLSFSGATIGDTQQQTFTVQNNGSTATGAVTVAISGGSVGASDFTQTNTCSTVPAGGTCVVTVTYKPTVTSANASATVSATPGGSATVALAGSALPRLQLISINSAPPTNPYDFGDVFVGSFVTVALDIRNNTNSAQNVSQILDSGADNSFRTFGTSCNGTVAAHSDCIADIYFLPTTVGAKKATASFSTGGGAADQLVVQFKGNGIAAITIAPVTTSDFGNVVLNTTSPVLRFRVTNNALLQSVGTPTGSVNTSAFKVTSGTCTGMLPPALFGASYCDLYVTFTPNVLGPFVTTLTATSTPGGTASIDLHGTGVDATNLQLAPTSADYGTLFSGGSKDVTFVLQNPAGAQTSGPLAITLTGAGEFQLLAGMSGDCPNDGVGTLANGLTCNIRVRFAPSDEVGTTTQSSQLTVKATPGATGSGISASLTGVTKSKISVTPTTYDFGLLQTPNSATKDFVVHNDSAGSVTFVAPAFSGTSTDLSVSSSTCTGSLAAGASCTVTVKFAPTSNTDQDSATLTIAAANHEGNALVTITAKSTDVLYAQPQNGVVNGPGSGKFGSTLYGSADDFIVPSGGWTLTSIDVTELMHSTGNHFAVTFYADNSGTPGSVVGTYSNLTYTVVEDLGIAFGAYTHQTIELSLPSVGLAAGHYWVNVEDTDDYTYWETRSITTNYLFVTTSCGSYPNYAPATTCPYAGYNDESFTLHGHAGSGPHTLVPGAQEPTWQKLARTYRGERSHLGASARDDVFARH